MVVGIEIDNIFVFSVVAELPMLFVVYVLYSVHTNSERHAVNQIAKFMLELIYLSSGCWYYNLYKQHTEMLPHAKHIQPYMYVLYTFVHI